jgi:signal transduction histidine kinase
MPENELSGRKSLGLLGMQERAMVFGEGLTICSAPGVGATVKVAVPGA